MARRIRVLRTECRSKRINLSQSRSRQLALQLSGNRQAGLLAKEVIIIDDRTILVFLQVVEVHRRYLEHLSGTLAIRCRNDRRMEIEESTIMEELMDCVSHIMTDTEYRAKRIRTRTQVSDLAQEFH